MRLQPPLLVLVMASFAGCTPPDDAPADAASIDASADRPASPDVALDAPLDARPDASADVTPDASADVAPEASPDAAPDAPLDAAPDVSIDAPLDVAPDVAPDVARDASADSPADDGPGVMLEAPRALGPVTGAHAPTRRPTLRWTRPAGATAARVSICRDHALTQACVSFDATESRGAPTVDLAGGVWFWSVRGLVGSAVSASASPARRIIVPITPAARSEHPWGGDLDVNGDGYADVLTTVRNGALRIYPGGPGGTSQTPQVLDAPFDSTRFGESAAASDVDGDGFVDVVVGSPGSDGIYLYRGSPSGLLPAPTLLTGPRGSEFGASVIAADMNGDGFADLFVAARIAATSFFVPGSASGLGTPVRLGFDAGRAGAMPVGDFNGDGYDDVFIAPTVLLGGAVGLRADRAISHPLIRGPIGDMNGDGVADMLTLSSGGDYLLSNIAFGGATWPGASMPVRATELAPSPSFAPGDYNGDGFSDLVYRGAAQLSVRSGSATGSLVSTEQWPGFGTAPSDGAIGVGDVDGDGYDDLLSFNNANTFFITRGSASGPALNSDVTAYPLPDLLDESPPPSCPSCGVTPFVLGAGDVNHDGLADLLVGRASTSAPTVAAALFFGARDGISPTPATRWTPATFAAPWRIAGAGDLTGDGFDDVIVSQTTEVQVFGGSSAGAPAAPSLRLSVLTPLDVSSLGDVNGDRRPDVGVGGAQPRIFYGVASGATPALVAIGDPVSVGAHVTAAGDVNGDGFDDVLLGIDVGELATTVYPGSATGPRMSTPLWRSPTRLLAIGDVNQDGYDDLAAFGDASGGATGIALGSATGPLPRTVVSGARSFAQLGDVNRDGFDDVIVDGPQGLAIYTGSAAGVTPWVASGAPYTLGSAPPWYPAFGTRGVGDLDGDGTADHVEIRRGVLMVHRTSRIRGQSTRYSLPSGVTFAVAF